MQHLAGALQRRDGVLQLVRDEGDEVHLHAVESLEVRDVTEDRALAHRLPAGLIDKRNAGQHHAALGLVEHHLGLPGASVGREGYGEHLDQDRMVEDGDGGAPQRPAGVDPEHALGRVVEDDDAVGLVGGDHAVAHFFHQRGEARHLEASRCASHWRRRGSRDGQAP